MCCCLQAGRIILTNTFAGIEVNVGKEQSFTISNDRPRIYQLL